MSYVVSDDFTNGNIIVKSIDSDKVVLSFDMRGGEAWCHWAFEVSGANGKTLEFIFENEDWSSTYACHTRCDKCMAVCGRDACGYFGPAVSHDLINWKWLYSDAKENASERLRFTYSFSHDEDKVYFAHCMLYNPERFNNLDFMKHGILCTDIDGSPVPYSELGDGENIILFTARHHSAEAPANYIMEGALMEMKDILPNNYKIIAIPFIDMAGVVAGDQGKGRLPHDHNRDYISDSIYPSVIAVKKLFDSGKVRYSFDLHSPCHLGNGSDLMSFANSFAENRPKAEKLSSLFANELNDECFKYIKGTISQPLKPTEGTSQVYAVRSKGVRFASTMESPYFGTANNPMTDTRYINTGRAYARAIIKFIKDDEDDLSSINL